MDERGKIMIAIGAGGADEIIPRRSVGGLWMGTQRSASKQAVTRDHVTSRAAGRAPPVSRRLPVQIRNHSPRPP
jgi:hypothetical protein